MMHFGVALVMNLGMNALDERFLLLNGNHDPLPRVSIRGKGQQSVRVSLHHLQVAFLIQIPLGDLLPKKLLSYPGRKRGLTLLRCDGINLPFPIQARVKFPLPSLSNKGKLSLLRPRLDEHRNPH